MRPKKEKKQDRRGRHTKAERLARIRAAKKTISIAKCRGCEQELDMSILTEEGDAIVCTNCGLVDNNLVFDYDSPIYTHVPCSPFYRHRNYFAEKLLQARNKEPRLSDQELDIMSVVYDIYREECPELWNEGNFTKKHCGKICRVIKRIYPNSPFSRRIERWYQYRVYIAGESNGELDFHVSTQLRFLFDAYVHYFLIYIQENNLKRKNITQLDLVIMILLYNLKIDYLRKYGWYFMNHNIINQTPSITRDIKTIENVFEIINSRILKDKKHHDITTMCYLWFRKGNTLKLPSLKKMITECMNTPLGIMQYANYRTNNAIGHIHYLESNKYLEIYIFFYYSNFDILTFYIGIGF